MRSRIVHPPLPPLLLHSIPRPSNLLPVSLSKLYVFSLFITAETTNETGEKGVVALPYFQRGVRGRGKRPDRDYYRIPRARDSEQAAGREKGG